MGSRSSSATSSQTVNDIDTTQTNQQDVGGHAVSASGGGSVSIVETDQGAVNRAFDFGTDALAGFGEIANRGINDAFAFARESLGLVERSAGQAQKTFEGALASTLNNLDEEQSGGAQRVLLLAVLAIAAVVAVGFLRR